MEIVEMIKKHATSLLLLFVFLGLGFLAWGSVSSYGAEGRQEMSLGGGYVSTGETVYFGVYPGQPVEFLTLNDQGELYSVLILGRTVYDEVDYDPLDGSTLDEKNVWVGSVAEAWCENEFYAKAFSALEKTGILPITKTDPDYGFPWVSQDLVNSHAYFISEDELIEYFPEKEDRIAYMADGSQPNYWTRTPYGTAVLVRNLAQSCDTTSVGSSFAYSYRCIGLGAAHKLGARPALSLDKEKIFLVSQADGGKLSGPVGEKSLVKIPEAAGDEKWKLTLRDDSAGFRAEVTEKTNRDVTVRYEGAYTGEQGFVSLMLLDAEGKALYYGHIAQNSAAGTQKVSLPAGLPVGDYSLQIFTETIHGDRLTDSACPAEAEPLTIVPEYTITYLLGGGNLDGDEGPIVKVYPENTLICLLDAPRREGYNFLYWEDSRYDAGAEYRVSENHNFTAVWEELGKEEKKDVVEGTPKPPATTLDRGATEMSAGGKRPAKKNAPSAHVSEEAGKAGHDSRSPATGDASSPLPALGIALLSLTVLLGIRARQRA